MLKVAVTQIVMREQVQVKGERQARRELSVVSELAL